MLGSPRFYGGSRRSIFDRKSDIYRYRNDASFEIIDLLFCSGELIAEIRSREALQVVERS